MKKGFCYIPAIFNDLPYIFHFLPSVPIVLNLTVCEPGPGSPSVSKLFILLGIYTLEYFLWLMPKEYRPHLVSLDPVPGFPISNSDLWLYVPGGGESILKIEFKQKIKKILNLLTATSSILHWSLEPLTNAKAWTTLLLGTR